MDSLKLNLDVKEIYKLKEFIEKIIQKKDFKVDLIVEEIFVNIVNYSNADYVHINADYDDHALTIEFVDNGMKFDPTLSEGPQKPDSIEDARIGGLGIFLSKQLADDLDYQYVNGENHLKIIKTVE